MKQSVSLGKGGAQVPCCTLMKRKPSFSVKVNGLALPGLPITSLEDFASFVKDLQKMKDSLEKPLYKILGQKPGDNQELMTLKTPEQVNMILALGGEINICGAYRPLIE